MNVDLSLSRKTMKQFSMDIFSCVTEPCISDINLMSKDLRKIEQAKYWQKDVSRMQQEYRPSRINDIFIPLFKDEEPLFPHFSLEVACVEHPIAGIDVRDNCGQQVFRLAVGPLCQAAMLEARNVFLIAHTDKALRITGGVASTVLRDEAIGYRAHNGLLPLEDSLLITHCEACYAASQLFHTTVYCLNGFTFYCVKHR